MAGLVGGKARWAGSEPSESRVFRCRFSQGVAAHPLRQVARTRPCNQSEGPDPARGSAFQGPGCADASAVEQPISMHVPPSSRCSCNVPSEPTRESNSKSALKEREIRSCASQSTKCHVLRTTREIKREDVLRSRLLFRICLFPFLRRETTEVQYLP